MLWHFEHCCNWNPFVSPTECKKMTTFSAFYFCNCPHSTVTYILCMNPMKFFCLSGWLQGTSLSDSSLQVFVQWKDDWKCWRWRNCQVRENGFHESVLGCCCCLFFWLHLFDLEMVNGEFGLHTLYCSSRDIPLQTQQLLCSTSSASQIHST